MGSSGVANRAIWADTAPSLSRLPKLWPMVMTFLVLVAIAWPALADDHRGRGEDEKFLEQDLSNDSTRWEGEPWLYVNPVDHTNVISGYTSVPKDLPPAPAFFSILDFEVAHVAVSHDSGKTWNDQILPNMPTDKVKGDAFVAAGPDGTLYAGGMILTPGPITGADMVIRSRDEGKTWSQPTEAIGDENPVTLARFAPGQEPIIGPVAAVDRGWISVDQSNGAVWVSGRSDSPTVRRWMVVSHDDARTWGTIYAYDSPDYPQINDGDLSAANGVIAAVYVAGSTPVANITCPCVVFETSKHDGNNLQRYVVPLADGVSQDITNPGLVVAADPSNHHHYAIALLNGTATKVEVYNTWNSGKSWSSPQVISETDQFTHFKIWCFFSPQGVLGVMWRTLYNDGSYDVWANFSRGDDEDFDEPVRVSTAISPGYPPNYMFGDDNSSIFLDEHLAWIGWGDSRTGDLNAWYVRLPFESDEHQGDRH